MVGSSVAPTRGWVGAVVFGSFTLGGLVVFVAGRMHERAIAVSPVASVRATLKSRDEAPTATLHLPFSLVASATPGQPVNANPRPVENAAANGREAEPPGPTMADFRDFYQILFDEEKVDFAWARESSGLISEKIKEMCGPGSRLVSAECKSTICRVEIASDDHAAYEGFSDKFRTSMFWSGPGIFTRRDSSSKTDYTSLLYLVRKGTALRDPF